MTSDCATLTSNVPAHSEVFPKPVLSLQVVSLQNEVDSLQSRFAVSCPGGAEINFFFMKPFKRHLKLTANG